MIFPPITELTIIGVENAGIPNRERIVLRPTELINLAQFGIILGYRQATGITTPWKDNFFWFGELIVEPPSWIFVYTGKGLYQQAILPDSGHKTYSMHWGRDYTVFNLPTFVPVLFRMDAILIGELLIDSTKKLQK